MNKIPRPVTKSVPPFGKLRPSGTFRPSRTFRLPTNPGGLAPAPVDIWDSVNRGGAKSSTKPRPRTAKSPTRGTSSIAESPAIRMNWLRVARVVHLHNPDNLVLAGRSQKWKHNATNCAGTLTRHSEEMEKAPPSNAQCIYCLAARLGTSKHKWPKKTGNPSLLSGLPSRCPAVSASCQDFLAENVEETRQARTEEH